MSVRSVVDLALSFIGLSPGPPQVSSEIRQLNHLYRNHQGVVDGAVRLAQIMTEETAKQDVRITELKQQQAKTQTTLEVLLKRQRK